MIVEDKEIEVPMSWHKVVTDHFVRFCGDCVVNMTGSSIYKDAHYTEKNAQTKETEELNVTWREVNQYVLGGLDMSYENFLEKYDYEQLYVVSDSTYNELAKRYDYQYTPIEKYVFNAKDPGRLLDKTYKTPSEWATSTNIMTLQVLKGHDAPYAKDTVIFAYKPYKETEKNPTIWFRFAYEIGAPTPHIHDFNANLVLNPDYLLGDVETRMTTPVDTEPANLYDPEDDDYTKWAGVKVKGKLENEAYVYSSSVIEHFKEYGKGIEFKKENGVDPTITFEIINNAKAGVQDKVPYEKGDFLFTKNGSQKEGTISDDGQKLTITGTQWESWKQQATSPDIIYNNSYLAEDTKVLVKITQTCPTDAKQTCVGYYYVVFQSLFEINCDDVVLGTYKTKRDAVDVREFVSVVERATGEKLIVWDAKAEKLVATDYAKTEYSFTDDDIIIEFQDNKVKGIYAGLGYPYPEHTMDSFGMNLETVEGTTVVTWYNDGTDLQYDKLARYYVTITVNGSKYVFNGDGKVIVLSTANTVARDEAAAEM